MNDVSWQTRFQQIFSDAERRYREGSRGANACVSEENVRELAEIGYRPQELYDFVDDLVRYGEPSFDTALAVAAVRRDYFLNVLKGKWPEELPSSTLPPKAEEVEGIPWLPRLIEKARRKLRGQMDEDLMYGCGGDRGFFRRTGIKAEDFLTEAWAAGDDNQRLVEFVKAAMK